MSFAKLNSLSQEQTLALFAEHYAAVLATPEGTDHQNIRQFMQHGWDEVQFQAEALQAVNIKKDLMVLFILVAH